MSELKAEIDPIAVGLAALFVEHQDAHGVWASCRCGWAAYTEPIEIRNEKKWPDHLAEVVAQFLRDLDALDDAMHEPCYEEIHSLDYFRGQPVDAYWITCTKVGPHGEHEDSNTGAHWPAEPVKRSGTPGGEDRG